MASGQMSVHSMLNVGFQGHRSLGFAVCKWVWKSRLAIIEGNCGLQKPMLRHYYNMRETAVACLGTPYRRFLARHYHCMAYTIPASASSSLEFAAITISIRQVWIFVTITIWIRLPQHLLKSGVYELNCVYLTHSQFHIRRSNCVRQIFM